MLSVVNTCVVTHMLRKGRHAVNGRGDEQDIFIPLRSGIRIEFDDRSTATNHLGQKFTASGTVVYYSFKHQTWTIHPAERFCYFPGGRLALGSDGVMPVKATPPPDKDDRGMTEPEFAKRRRALCELAVKAIAGNVGRHKHDNPRGERR